MITEQIARLYFTHYTKSYLFYMGFSYGDAYSVFDAIFTKNNQVDSKKLYNLVKKYYGIYATYECINNKHILTLKFYWNKSTTVGK